MTNGAAWRSRLMSDYWFAHLPADLQDSLLNVSRQTRRTSGKLLIAKGAAPCGLYALLEGAVRMGAAHEQRLVPRLAEARQPLWFGEVSLFDGLPRRFDVFAAGHSIFLHVPQAELVGLLEKNPAHWRPFAELLGEKLEVPLMRPEGIKRLPDKARVARRLLLLAEGYGHLSHARRLITFAEIQADETVGLAPEALLEVLLDLHKRKILRLGDGQLEIFDVSKLRKAASVVRAKSVC